MIHNLKSFNEKGNVLFDVEPHTYTYKGQRLQSATGIIERYHEEFDSFEVSGRSSQKWGEDQEDILAMWNSNGEVAAGFGTAVHAVIEHYFTHKKLGARIQAKTGKEHNAAMPNHPFLRQLIYDLEKIRLDGDSKQEVLITRFEQGICGLVDDLLILDKTKKICRVRDYKITADILVDKSKLFEPFAFLGANKLAKNFLQLGIYSYMLQMSGWKVEGVDIFNWNGEWSKYSLESKDLTKVVLTVGSELYANNK